jgi:hypothetical protein
MSITGTQHPCGRSHQFVNKFTIALEATKAIFGQLRQLPRHVSLMATLRGGAQVASFVTPKASPMRATKLSGRRHR